MTNNELMQIKDDKERFAMTRKEVIGESCKDVTKRRISIRKSVLENLENDGFNIEDLGTQYLASLITLLYHERKLYRRKNIKGKAKYWNLADWNNEHFGMLGSTKENVINAILNSISTNTIEGGPIDELVYEIADNTIYHYNRDERRVRYEKLLTKEKKH